MVKTFSQLSVDTNSSLGCCQFPKPSRPKDASLTSKESVNKSIHSMSGPERNDKFGFPKSLAVSRDKVGETSRFERKQNLIFFFEN